jgi:hypothetical protein
MSFLTRPHIEDRQFVQHIGESITLSGLTNYGTTSVLTVESTILDFTGTTTASTTTTINGLTGYLNGDNRISGLVVKPPVLLLSGTTGTTTVDVTGFVLKSLDSQGTVYWDVDSGITGTTQSPFIYNPNLPSPNTSVVPDFGNNEIETSPTYSSILGGGNNSIRSFSHNSIIGGGSGNTITNNSSNSSIVGGRNNSLNFLTTESSIIGGLANSIVGSQNSVIGGGVGNVITNTGPIIAENGILTGYYNNIVGGQRNSVVGGTFNYLSGDNNFIGGGTTNYNIGNHNFIGGGLNNYISTNYSSIIGGVGNEISSSYSSIIGGGVNLVNGGQYNGVGFGKNNIISGSTYSSILGGYNNIINNLNNTNIIGSNIIAVSANTTHVNNLNIYDTPITDNTINEFLVRDSDGQIKIRTDLGNSITINSYYIEPSNVSITWDLSGTSTNYETTLTGNTTLDLINVRNGEFGTIIVKQDGVGNRLLTFGTVNGSATTHRVVNGGGGSPTLTSNANTTDILSFTYNGNAIYWTIGNDYT